MYCKLKNTIYNMKKINFFLTLNELKESLPKVFNSQELNAKLSLWEVIKNGGAIHVAGQHYGQFFKPEIYIVHEGDTLQKILCEPSQGDSHGWFSNKYDVNYKFTVINTISCDELKEILSCHADSATYAE